MFSYELSRVHIIILKTMVIWEYLPIQERFWLEDAADENVCTLHFSKCDKIVWRVPVV